MKKIGFAVISSLVLAGCGGGGGGGASLISEWLGTDPNAIVTTPSGKTYDLRHGTQDPDGTEIAKLFDNAASVTGDVPAFIFNGVARDITKNCAIPEPCGPTIPAPHPDVITAWKNGWTGLGVNILVVDSIGETEIINGTSRLNPHGALVAATALRHAVRSSMYGLNWDAASPAYLDIEGTPIDITTPTKMGVVNASFGYSVERRIGRPNDPSNPWTLQEKRDARNAVSTFAFIEADRLVTGVGEANLQMTDAVITKSAGNEGIEAEFDSLTYSLAYETGAVDRLLVVGALNTAGFTNNKATIADYSNVAGSDSVIQNRFLVASGVLPFDPTTLEYDGITVADYYETDDVEGTSFAAPRVAGYAAILRHKFPNLTGANTADLLLQTARYDTLTCYPNCNKAIYGQGEASLSRAMSPFGGLR